MTLIQTSLDLVAASQHVIRAGQVDTGAYLASTTFSQYGYSWLRDGAWIAHAMHTMGDTDSADRFHRWSARTLLRYQIQIEHVVTKRARGEPIRDEELLPTRFQADGSLGTEVWTDFQLDGYGAWLWSLAERCGSAEHPLWRETRSAVALVVRYLAALWSEPNYDCWEEFRDEVHTATLGALYGGLNAVARLDSSLIQADLPVQIRQFILERCVSADEHFVKFIGNDAVDASLLWLAVPFGVVSPDDPRFTATLAKIERDLRVPNGGVYRYRADTYFGGGEWVLLAASLGLAYAALGRDIEACAILRWVEAQATADGALPEQTAEHLLVPAYYPIWVARWGTPALPLLWSHATYLLLHHTLEGRCQ